MEEHDFSEGNLSEEVDNLKKQSGKGLIVYGGAGFVSSLIRENLIDEYYLFINPAAIGIGLGIFNNIKERLNLKLVNTKTFSNGIVGLFYKNTE